MRGFLVGLVLSVGALAAPAHAEVRAASASSFIVHGEQLVSASPEQAWRSVGRIGQWWDSAHTYSGDARRMSVQMRAGACFCERWSGQSVEHARVLMVMEQQGARTVRMSGALGPLQEMGASGVLTITVTSEGEGARIAMDYRVSGDGALGLDAIAPAVDGVLMTQLERLSRYAATGDAEQ